MVDTQLQHRSGIEGSRFIVNDLDSIISRKPDENKATFSIVDQFETQHNQYNKPVDNFNVDQPEVASTS